MKKILKILFLVFCFLLFCIFLFYRKNTEYRVLCIISPTEIIVDFNNNQKPDIGEKICIKNLSTFTSNLSVSQDSKARNLRISMSDAISIGYLSDEFVRNILQDKKVNIHIKNQHSVDCNYADIFIDNQNYADLLTNSGFAICNEKICNKELFNKKLEQSRKLNLVILNKKSGKYHKLDCKYGLNSREYTILPIKIIPDKFKKCKYCFKTATPYKNKKELNKIDKTSYPEIYNENNITFLVSDYTNHLRPDNSCEYVFCKTLIDIINNTQKTLDIALYGWNTSPKILEALTSAQNRNVNIRIVYDKNPNPNYYPDIDEFIKLFKNKRSDEILEKKSLTSILMHNKFIISDIKLVLTGSMNFTNTDLSGFNANNVLIINSEQIAKYYKKEFEQMYKGKFHLLKKKFSEKNSFSIDDTNFRIYFSPQDKTIESAIIPLIDNAEKYIYIPIFVITHKNMCKSLIEAQKRGVDVRIILDATSIRARNSTHNYLRNNGIKLKTENYAGKMHSKSIIIDDKYVVTGSMNFSNSGENKNDENTVIIENPRLAEFYKGYFEFLWNKIPDYYLNHSVSAESKYSIGSCHDGIDNDYDGKIDSQDEGCR